MKYLRNPLSGEVKHASPLEAKRLARYGWEYTKREAWVDYQRQLVRLAMAKHIPATRRVVGSVH